MSKKKARGIFAITANAQNILAEKAKQRAEAEAEATNTAAAAASAPVAEAPSTVEAVDAPAPEASPSPAPIASAVPRPAGGVSGVASMFERGERSLRQKVLDAQREAREAKTQEIDTADVVPSRFYNRFDLDLEPTADESFRDLIASVKGTNGNVINVQLNRRPGHEKLELVYGHRRWAACRAAGVPLRAVISDDLEPTVIAELQLWENSHRKDPSVIDKARQMLSQLEANAWTSQEHIANSIKVSTGYVSRLLDIARHLPMSLQMAHPNHHKISLRQAADLVAIQKTKPDILKQRIEQVRAQRSLLSAEAATQLLRSGSLAQPSGAKVGATVSFTSSKTGATLKVRGLSNATSLALTARLEELLKEFGLHSDAPKGHEG